MSHFNARQWALLVLTSCVFNTLVIADFDVCNQGASPSVYRFKQENCPFGVLFNQPITAHCLASTNEPGHFFSDLCDNDKFTVNLDDKPYKVQIAFNMNEEPLEDPNTCEGDGPEKCSAVGVNEVTATTLTEPRDEDDEEMDDEELTPEEKSRQNDTLVLDQTERLFKYMFGLSGDAEDDGSGMRLTKMLVKSFKILGKFCDSRYVPMEFGRDVLKAFLFLIRESEISRLVDIPVSDYEIIKGVLDDCEGRPAVFNFTGKTCKTYAQVRTIEKMNRTVKLTQDEFSFKWGKYDVPVDAAWGVLQFVHGLCYGNFKHNVNFHHLYQRAIELLFTKEIVYRWNHPPKLHNEELWDHMFSASTKNAMKNIDACVVAAYHDAPFLHRLERPLTGRPDKTKVSTGGTGGGGTGGGGTGGGGPGTSGRRRKRSLPSMTLGEGGLAGAGWCFQNEYDLIKTSEAYVSNNCPEVTKPLEELKRIREFLKQEAEGKNDTIADGSVPDP